MRTSSNPAFRNLPAGGYATFGGGHQGGYPDAAPPVGGDVQRPMTVDDVVSKTALCLGTVVVAGVLTAALQLYALAFPAMLVGFVLGLVNSFKREPSPALIVTFCVAMGVFLGGLSGMLHAISGTSLISGIVGQAIIGTGGVFAGMLFLYKTGTVRVTPRLRKWVVGAMLGVFVLVVTNFLASLFTPGGFGLLSGGPMTIVIALVAIGAAAFSFLLDFDAADQMIRAGAPQKYAWTAAFGLTFGLVYLYYWILILLWSFYGE